MGGRPWNLDKPGQEQQKREWAALEEKQVQLHTAAAWDVLYSLEHVMAFSPLSKVLVSKKLTTFTGCQDKTRDQLLDYVEAYHFLRTKASVDANAFRRAGPDNDSGFDVGDRVFQMLAAAAFARKAPYWSRRSMDDHMTVTEILTAASNQASEAGASHDACFLTRCRAENVAMQSSRGRVSLEVARHLEAEVATQEGELRALAHEAHMKAATAAARRAVFSAGGEPRSKSEIAELQCAALFGKSGSALLADLSQTSGRSFETFREYWYANESHDEEADGAPIDWKIAGNEAFKHAEWEGAHRLYSVAIASSTSPHILHSNRAAASLALANERTHERLAHAQAALADAERCIELDPSFGKGYYRRAVALQLLGKTIEARKAFEEVVKQSNKGRI